MADHSAAQLVDVIRRLHGDDAVRITPFVPIGHVSVELRDGTRRLYDSFGNQVGRDLPPRS